MRTRIKIWTLLLAFGLCACAAESASQATPAALPPTQTPVKTATQTEAPTVTPSPTAAATPTAQSNCVNSALFLSDVTIQDGTNVPAGQAFSKTWRLRNDGTCIWNSGYTLNFISGDQMDAPASIPLSETAPGAELELSVELTAPATDGAFAAFFEIRDPAGKIVPVGFLTNIWVKITVGTAISAPVSTAAPANPGPTGAPGSGICNPSLDGSTAGEIIALINSARAENGLAALTQNAKLDAAAQTHSSDMACNNLRSHTGSDGSSVGQRVAAAGYASSRSEEVIYVGGGASAAFGWWMNDPVHRDAILLAGHAHIGVGVSNLPGSAFGTYIAVVLAAP
ncbi:MAG: CAP domain-containing protein [Anaerolineae bacterium]|nr:CAP domain-containing protein [Anaerolineae bacterium]